MDGKDAAMSGTTFRLLSKATRPLKSCRITRPE
jgi:hypothetical protein